MATGAEAEDLLEERSSARDRGRSGSSRSSFWRREWFVKSTPWEDHKRGGQVNFVTLTQNNWPSGRGATLRWTNVKLPPPINPECLGHGRHWVVNCNLTLTRHQLDGSCRSCSALGPRDTSRVLGHEVSTALLPKGHLNSWWPLLAGLLWSSRSQENCRQSSINKKRSDGKVDFYPPLKIQEHWRYRNTGDTGTLEILEHWRCWTLRI